MLVQSITYIYTVQVQSGDYAAVGLRPALKASMVGAPTVPGGKAFHSRTVAGKKDHFMVSVLQ